MTLGDLSHSFLLQEMVQYQSDCRIVSVIVAHWHGAAVNGQPHFTKNHCRQNNIRSLNVGTLKL